LSNIKFLKILDQLFDSETLFFFLDSKEKTILAIPDGFETFLKHLGYETNISLIKGDSALIVYSNKLDSSFLLLEISFYLLPSYLFGIPWKDKKYWIPFLSLKKAYCINDNIDFDCKDQILSLISYYPKKVLLNFDTYGIVYHYSPKNYIHPEKREFLHENILQNLIEQEIGNRMIS